MRLRGRAAASVARWKARRQAHGVGLWPSSRVMIRPESCHVAPAASLCSARGEHYAAAPAVGLGGALEDNAARELGERPGDGDGP